MNYIVFISFLLDGIITNFIRISSNVFIPLFTLTSLVIIFPYYHKEKEYFKMCILFGFLYDIVFCNTLFINIGLFIMVGFVTKTLNYYLSNNILNNTIMLIINIILYRISFYFILFLANIFKFDFMLLFKSIYSSFFINILYSFILYFILEKVMLKKRY